MQFSKDMQNINMYEPLAPTLITGWLYAWIPQRVFAEESLQLAQHWLSFSVPTDYLHSPFVNFKW